MSSKDRRVVRSWSLIKNEIIERYANAYTTILSSKGWPRTIYVDVFAGSPVNFHLETGLTVAGSASRALKVQPPFNEFLFIDNDQTKIRDLQELCSQAGAHAQVRHGDGNEVLRSYLLPRLRSEKRLRALILADPYGMHLEWDVVKRLAQTEHVDVFINFPIMDINRNALRNNPSRIETEAASRMDRLWGDDSWRREFFSKSPQLSLFGDQDEVKSADNAMVAQAYCERLQQAAGFQHVGTPLEMRNSGNATLYYLIFASSQPVAKKIADDIFNSERKRRVNGDQFPH